MNNVTRFYPLINLIVFLSFSSFSAFSQKQEVDLSLKGRVIDKKTKKPIPGALVKLIRPNGGFIRVKTNAEGIYVFDKDENRELIQPGASYILSVSANNYAIGEAVKVNTRGITASQEIIRNLELNPFGKKRPAVSPLYDDDDEEEEEEDDEDDEEDGKRMRNYIRF